MRLAVAICVALVIACSCSSDREAPVPEHQPPGTAARLTAASGAPPDDAASGLSLGSGYGSSNGSSRDPRCGEPCLFLPVLPLASVGSAYKAACGDEARPLGDCTVVDFARNCIYAAHGATFTTAKWKAVFASKPWYRPNPAVAAKSLELSEIERANVKALLASAKACRGKLNISAADTSRVRAWFAALPEVPASPAIAIENDSGSSFVDGKQLVAALGKLAKPIRANVRAGKNMSADYVSPPLIKPTLAGKSRDIREVLLAITAPGREPPGIYAELLYDGDDQLVGVSVQWMTQEDVLD
jgi:hypothetical protein